MPAETLWPASAVDNGQLYRFGGESSFQGTVINNVQIFQPRVWSRWATSAREKLGQPQLFPSASSLSVNILGCNSTRLLSTVFSRYLGLPSCKRLLGLNTGDGSVLPPDVPATHHNH
jgi:hypothetical protein